ncbi:hypothetical protein M513_04198, partial [Trichuris suis]
RCLKILSVCRFEPAYLLSVFRFGRGALEQRIGDSIQTARCRFKTQCMPFKLRELMVIMCLDVTGPQVVTIDTSDWHHDTNVRELAARLEVHYSTGSQQFAQIERWKDKNVFHPMVPISMKQAHRRTTVSKCPHGPQMANIRTSNWRMKRTPEHSTSLSTTHSLTEDAQLTEAFAETVDKDGGTRAEGSGP